MRVRFNLKNMKKIKLVLFLLFFVVVNSCEGSDDLTPEPIIDKTPPTAPANLIATNTTHTKTDLNWTRSSDDTVVKEYLIYKDGVNLYKSSTNSYSVKELIANTSYSFKVKAKDIAGNESKSSNVIQITTIKNDPVVNYESGDIENYLGDFIDNSPDNSGNDYVIPSTSQIETWDSIIDAILSDDISEAVQKSSEMNYQITEFTDTSLNPNQVFYILEEKSPSVNNWGTFAFSKTPELEQLIIQAPHSKYDTNTGKEALYCFKNNVAKAIFINGTHRCNSSNLSSCSGTTSACGSTDSFRVSDMAHNTISMYQKTTENLFANISNSVFVQLHGFGKQSSDPYVIMSNGTRETPSIDYATLIKDALFLVDNTLTFKLAHIDTNWTRLIGFTNTQGRLINNSDDFCSTSATSTSGRFIHIEQEKSKLRENEEVWVKMSNALKVVFEQD